MLAGAIGPRRERSDTLALPRAQVVRGRVGVKLANWAPEIEHLDKLELGFVEAQPGEQLDCDANGTAYLWRESQVLPSPSPRTETGRDHWSMKFAPVPDPSVLVLELRNTEQFQDLAKRCYARDEEPSATLHVEGATRGEIGPIGTKFFRRVVVPLPANASEIRLHCPAGLWWVRRGWLGSGHPASMKWVSPFPNCEGAAALQARDGDRLRLGPGEEVESTFALPEQASEDRNIRLALRLFGYYEFVQPQ
jgi:hypothetical protein